ncbi:fibronectin type III domain-containing protein [Citrifermentans bremense]|nr:fibronectin type III domain-containing protein [Citrifermentans bremense]
MMAKVGNPFLIFILLLMALSLSACGGSPWRYDAGVPAKPAGLVAVAQDGAVALSWAPAVGATTYNVYYATAPGVSAGTAQKMAGVSGTSVVLPGLLNNTRYYLAVSAVNAKGEGAFSDEASATPVPGAFRQSDLEGSWRFQALVTGAGARWMRGVASIDVAGSVTVASYLDSNGSSAAPAELFTAMTMHPDGTVSQNGAAAGFHGVLSAGVFKDLLVATAPLAGSSGMLVILQKSVPGITYSPADVKGTGRLAAGPLPYVYHQLSGGGLKEWEYASCQVGQDQGVTYLSIKGPTPRELPGGGSKVLGLSITPDGIVSEAPYPGVVPQPAALITHGVMSADKMTVVATATDSGGRPLLRIMQLVHPPSVSLAASYYLLSGLTGDYGCHELDGGAPGWSYGGAAVDALGGMSFSNFRDAGGASTAPAGFTVSLDQQGGMTTVSDPSYNGQLSYFKELAVSTRTAADGGSRLSVALRRAP